MTRADFAAQLRDLALQVRHLRPSHRDPEAFHVQKSEIENALRRLSNAAGQHGSRETALAGVRK